MGEIFINFKEESAQIQMDGPLNSNPVRYIYE